MASGAVCVGSIPIRRIFLIPVETGRAGFNGDLFFSVLFFLLSSRSELFPSVKAERCQYCSSRCPNHCVRISIRYFHYPLPGGSGSSSGADQDCIPDQASSSRQKQKRDQRHFCHSSRNRNKTSDNRHAPAEKHGPFSSFFKPRCGIFHIFLLKVKELSHSSSQKTLEPAGCGQAASPVKNHSSCHRTCCGC